MFVFDAFYPCDLQDESVYVGICDIKNLKYFVNRFIIRYINTVHYIWRTNMTILKTINAAQDRLCYSLTESVREDGSVCYGVKVTTTLFGEAESAEVEDISSDRQVAEKFLYMLADNLVLPSTLTEIAEEFVAAFYTV